MRSERDTDDSPPSADHDGAGLRRGCDGHDDGAGLSDEGSGFTSPRDGNGDTRTAQLEYHAGSSSARGSVGRGLDASFDNRHSAGGVVGYETRYTGWIEFDFGSGAHVVQFDLDGPAFQRHPTIVNVGVDRYESPILEHGPRPAAGHSVQRANLQWLDHDVDDAGTDDDHDGADDDHIDDGDDYDHGDDR